MNHILAFFINYNVLICLPVINLSIIESILKWESVDLNTELRNHALGGINMHLSS
jgi:hypothetical protein